MSGWAWPFDLILSNPPYVAAGDPHLESGDVRFEPHAALAAGVEGLEALRAVISAAPAHLRRHGALLVEHGHDQGEPVRRMLHAAGFRRVTTWRDLAGLERVSGGQLFEHTSDYADHGSP